MKIEKGKRIQDIERIIKELGVLKNGDNAYAVDKNVEFFEAIKSPLGYIYWLIFSANKIDKEKILELNDFPIDEWEEDLHRKLIKMERKKIPGMIEPLRKKILQIIKEENPKTVVNLGAGAMELERQVIEALIKEGYNKDITFIAVDKSDVAKRIAVENFGNLQDKIEIEQIGNINVSRLSEKNKKNIRVFLCSNDIFELKNEFNKGFFDLILFAKFKHHLRDRQKGKLEEIIRTIGKKAIEFDDYRSWGLLIPQSIATWRYPILINGAIFSRLRDYTKKELKEMCKPSDKLTFFANGSYLIEIDN